MENKKEVHFGPEARAELMEGINTLADAVVCTLGPNGRNVLIDNNGYNNTTPPTHTKDGVTVAKNITVDGLVKNLGAQMVKAAAIKTADKAGDGTTTSTLLARELVKTGLKHLNNGENAVEIKRSIDQAVKEVVEVVKSIFTHRRKKIRNCIKLTFPNLALDNLNYMDLRAEILTPSEIAELSNSIFQLKLK